MISVKSLKLGTSLYAGNMRTDSSSQTCPLSCQERQLGNCKICHRTCDSMEDVMTLNLFVAQMHFLSHSQLLGSSIKCFLVNKGQILSGHFSELQSVNLCVNSHHNLCTATSVFAWYSRLRIHLIGAELEFEGSCPTKWEIFLHLFPELKDLNIVLVGPELDLSKRGLANMTLCSDCVQKKRKICIQYKPELYHDYCQRPTFVQPNIRCAFHCGLYRTTGFVNPNEDSWVSNHHSYLYAASESAPNLICISCFAETNSSSTK